MEQAALPVRCSNEACFDAITSSEIYSLLSDDQKRRYSIQEEKVDEHSISEECTGFLESICAGTEQLKASKSLLRISEASIATTRWSTGLSPTDSTDSQRDTFNLSVNTTSLAALVDQSGKWNEIN